MIEPLVSVIVPVYNVEKYLECCVNSIVNQTYRNLEIILVDDGSTDSSLKICDEFAAQDNRIRVIHKENGGQCSARNAALDLCRGEWITFIDSDDYVNPEMISCLFEQAEKNEADIVRCAFMNVKESDSEYFDDSEANGDALLFSQKEMINNFLTAAYSNRKCFTACMWAAIYRRSLFDSIRFPEGLIHEEGFVLPDLFLKVNQAVFVDRFFYYYRTNLQGTMSTNYASKKSLKSIDDWKYIHFCFKNEYPEFNSVTCERWIRRYIKALTDIMNKPEIDTDCICKNKVLDTFKNDYEYFLEICDNRELVDKIKAINNSPEKWYRKEKKKSKTSVLSKIKYKIGMQ